MSVQKNKTFSKLKNKPIWPSILGLCILTFTLFIIYILNLALFTTNTVENKCFQSYEDTKKITEEINKNFFSNETQAKENIDDFIQFSTKILGIKIIRKRDNYPVYSYGTTDTKNPDFYTLNEEITFSFGSNDKNPIMNIKNDKIKIKSSHVFKQMVLNSESIKDRMQTIFTFNICFKMKLQNDDYYALVNNNIDVHQSDLDFVSITFVLLGILALVLFIFFIVIFIDFIIARFHVAKILYFDSVTGGNNWFYMQKQACWLLSTFFWRRKDYVIVNIRMEKYHNYCTCFGTSEGEELVEKIYKKLLSSAGKKEIVARHEKADFGLLLLFTSKEETENQVKAIINSLIDIEPDRKLYFNSGIYAIPNDKENVDIDSYYNFAYTACSQVSKLPDSNILWFSEEMFKAQLWERKVENEMERALLNKEFLVYLQPKYCTNEETLSAAEALVRWKSPTEGLVPPNSFIPIFEKNGFILKLDDYMISEVAKLQSNWIKEGKKIVPISVNVSRAHFTRSDLAEHICKLIDEYNVPHNMIELEITESAFFDDKSILLNTINTLRSYGFVVSMDDFGSGYSSLNTLKELPLDIVKLDAEFFRGEEEANKGRIIVEETISLAKKLNMKIVAEGIETREQVDFLKSQGCDLIQGYYFAKPLTVNDFEAKAF